MKAYNTMFILSACFSKHATSNERGSISQALQNETEQQKIIIHGQQSTYCT